MILSRRSIPADAITKLPEIWFIIIEVAAGPLYNKHELQSTKPDNTTLIELLSLALNVIQTDQIRRLANKDQYSIATK